MRAGLWVLIVLTVPIVAQEPVVNAPRFNILLNERFFPQSSPKATLQSVVKAADLGQFDYIAAYLMDTAAADTLIAQRAALAQDGVEKQLRDVRAGERRNPFKPLGENPVPVDPGAFAERAKAVATRRGFDQLTREISERFTQDPSHLRELQRYIRDGDVTVNDNAAKITLKADKSKVMNLKKVGTRWFLEDRTSE